MTSIPVTKEVQCVIEAVQEKKGLTITVLDLKKLTSFTDYFIICSGESEPQVKTISRNVQEKLASIGAHPHHVEGSPETGWILMDYDDFIVHVFLPDKRVFYELERLWADAPRVDIPDQTASVGARSGARVLR